MKRKYHVVSKGSKGAGKLIENFCQANGQMLLPLVDLIAEARLAVDEVIDQAGRSLIETILTVSAEQVAGAKTPGKASGEVRWHGRQQGRVRVADRQIKVRRPRLRSKAGGEVEVSAYQALRDSGETGAFLRTTPNSNYDGHGKNREMTVKSSFHLGRQTRSSTNAPGVGPPLSAQPASQLSTSGVST